MSVITTLKPVDSVEEYSNPNGVWQIKTEDVGGALKVLGIYEGDIKEILNRIGDKQCYSFFITKMKKVEIELDLPPKAKAEWDELNLCFSYIYNERNKDNFPKLFNSLFSGDSNLFFIHTNAYSIKLFKNEKAKKKREKYFEGLKEKALKKLTLEEKKVLGLIQ